MRIPLIDSEVYLMEYLNLYYCIAWQYHVPYGIIVTNKELSEIYSYILKAHLY
jgi:hypothetical protein